MRRGRPKFHGTHAATSMHRRPLFTPAPVSLNAGPHSGAQTRASGAHSLAKQPPVHVFPPNQKKRALPPLPPPLPAPAWELPWICSHESTQRDTLFPTRAPPKAPDPSPQTFLGAHAGRAPPRAALVPPFFSYQIGPKKLLF